MQAISFLVAYLACVGQGRGVLQTRSDAPTSTSHLEELGDTARRSRPLQSLAALLLSPDHPTTAWQLHGPGRNLVATSLNSDRIRPSSAVVMQPRDVSLDVLLAGPAPELIKELTAVDSRLDVPSSSVSLIIDKLCQYAESADEADAALQRSVQRAFGVLKRRGKLRAFGSCAETLPPLQRNMAAEEQQRVTGIAPEAFTQRDFFGGALEFFIVGLSFWSVLLGGAFLGVDPLLITPGIGALLIADRFGQDGAFSESLRRTLRFGSKETAVKREAGRLLIAYLLGNPVIACSLDGLFKGTTIYDPDLKEGQANGLVTRKVLERSSIVLMSGIAAEVLSTGKTTTGELDEAELLKTLNKEKWEFDQMQKQARWGISQAVLLLKQYKSAYDALCKALEEGVSLGKAIMTIEEAMSATDLPSAATMAQVAVQPAPAPASQLPGLSNTPVIPTSASPAPAPAPKPPPMSSQDVDKRLNEVEARLAKINARLTGQPEPKEVTVSLAESNVEEVAPAESDAKPTETEPAKPVSKEEELAAVDAKLDALKKRLAELDKE
mmetsp:Transcript_139168/g.259524  ORF Transcript_139168/g.259524 Transcript_139168/m.259524 type:complete len:552 (+) Transcript_139168:63-1718(+)